jgi:hypothetical protein
LPVRVLGWLGSSLWTARGSIYRLLGLVLVVALFLAAVVALGRYARQSIQESDRYAVPFADIECTPPPGKQRADFLAEVQYLSGSPDRIRLLDNDLPTRLSDAFARHPWVERVIGVIVAAPRSVEVRLAYRIPVLVVKHPSAGPWILDGHAHILPAEAKSNSLLVLQTDLQPKEPSGAIWRANAIERAAETAALLQPYQGVLRIERMEIVDGVLELWTGAGSRVRWGGLGKSMEEASTEQKLQRLLQYCRAHGSLDQPGGVLDHDVRTKVGVSTRPLTP